MEFFIAPNEFVIQTMDFALKLFDIRLIIIQVNILKGLVVKPKFIYTLFKYTTHMVRIQIIQFYSR